MQPAECLPLFGGGRDKGLDSFVWILEPAHRIYIADGRACSGVYVVLSVCLLGSDVREELVSLGFSPQPRGSHQQQGTRGLQEASSAPLLLAPAAFNAGLHAHRTAQRGRHLEAEKTGKSILVLF